MSYLGRMALLLQTHEGGTIPDWTLGDRIRKARETLKGPDGERTTIEQLAELIGCGKSTLGSWELDSHRPNINTVRRIAEVTGVDLVWLAGGDYDERGRRLVVTERYLTPPLDAYAPEAVFEPRPDHATVHWLPAPPIAA